MPASECNNNAPLVVLTYPGHYLLTALTINSYLKFHSPKSVTVVVDDSNEFAWPGYLADCEKLYQTTVISDTRLDFLQPFSGVPWIRQQLVKLYFDQLLDLDQWFFTDGDVEFCFPIIKNTIPYTYTQGGLVQQQQNNYVSRVLQIATPGIHQDRQVCVSNPPFRFMDSQTLQALRTHVETLHNTNFADLHWDISLDPKTINDCHQYYSISEWELLATFQTQILKLPIELEYYPTYHIGDSPMFSDSHPDYVKTCWCADHEIGREWFRSQGIECSDEIWTHLCKISK